MKNNMAPPLSTLQKTNVVYLFECPLPHCQAETYIGLTQTTLSRRLTMHGQNGSIYKHFTTCHSAKPSREQLTENTSIIAKATDRYKLLIKEALLIMKHSPSINIQYDNFTKVLKLHAHRNVNLPLTTRPAPADIPSTPTTPNIVPSAPPLHGDQIDGGAQALIHSPLNDKDTELILQRNTNSSSTSLNTAHLAELENSNNYPQIDPNDHSTKQANDLITEIARSSRPVNKTLSAPILL